MDLWANSIYKTREFILSDSPFVKTFHAINLNALAEIKNSASSPGEIVKEIDDRVRETNFHVGILKSSSEDEEELKEAAQLAIAEIIIQKPTVLRWLVVDLIRDGECAGAEILMSMARGFIEAVLDDKGLKQSDLWAKLEETYNEQDALSIDLMLHLEIMKGVEEAAK